MEQFYTQVSNSLAASELVALENSHNHTYVDKKSFMISTYGRSTVLGPKYRKSVCRTSLGAEPCKAVPSGQSINDPALLITLCRQSCTRTDVSDLIPSQLQSSGSSLSVASLTR